MAKILVVEDNLPISDMYALKLQRENNFEVITAADGSEGLQKAEDFRPDLILLDLLMPVMDGSAMLKKLREKDWGKDILVIILTNVSQDEAPMDLRLLRVEKYIVKAHATPGQVVDTVVETLKKYNKLTKA